MRAESMFAVQRDDRGEFLASALAAAFEAVAAELRLIDAADFIAYIHQEKFANIQDLVSSSVEIFFRPGTLTFGWGARYDLDWNIPPTITLDMEFRHHSVWLVFKLVLRSLVTDVRVDYLSCGKPLDGPEREFGLLMEAIADARLDSRGR